MSDENYDLQPGELQRTYTARCASCQCEQTVTRGMKIDGRWRIYRRSAEWTMRNIHYWTTRRGKWICGTCQTNILMGEITVEDLEKLGLV